MKEYSINKGTLKSGVFFQKKFVIVSIFFMLIPLFFVSEEMIISNDFLFSFSDLLLEYFNNIQRASELASTRGLEYKVKFIYTYSIFLGIAIFFMMLYFYGKAYLCSWNILKNCSKEYNINSIQKNKVDRPLFMFLYSISFTFIGIEFYYLGSFTNFIQDGYRISFIYKNSFTVTTWCTIGTMLGSFISYLVCELIAQIRKAVINFKE